MCIYVERELHKYVHTHTHTKAPSPIEQQIDKLVRVKDVNMAGNSGNWREVIEEVFSAERDTIHAISRFLWENPESSFNEVKAHGYLTNLLENEGFEVERRFVADTGFRAVFTYDGPIISSGDIGGDRLPHICFLCEYDSTEQVGHAAGHNLKCAASIAAALSIKECLRRKILRGKVCTIVRRFAVQHRPHIN